MGGEWEIDEIYPWCVQNHYYEGQFNVLGGAQETDVLHPFTKN